jgi:hypothetical protein
MRQFELTDFDTTGMSESAQIILLKHIHNMNMLVRKYNEFPTEGTKLDIEAMIPKSFNKKF